MELALAQAQKNLGSTKENPSVGCVIVKNNCIVGVGHTGLNGRPHAEKNAIIYSKNNIKNSDLYVTLEPCSHYGKTPPCVKIIIRNKIKRVFFASTIYVYSKAGGFYKASKQALENILKGGPSRVSGGGQKTKIQKDQVYAAFRKLRFSPRSTRGVVTEGTEMGYHRNLTPLRGAVQRQPKSPRRAIEVPPQAGPRERVVSSHLVTSHLAPLMFVQFPTLGRRPVVSGWAFDFFWVMRLAAVFSVAGGKGLDSLLAGDERQLRSRARCSTQYGAARGGGRYARHSADQLCTSWWFRALQPKSRLATPGRRASPARPLRLSLWPRIRSFNED